MAIDHAVVRSRRALLAAGLGGLGATILQAVGRPSAAAAANGDPLLVGQTTTATAQTTLSIGGNEDGFKVEMTNSLVGGTAITAAAGLGHAAMLGNSTTDHSALQVSNYGTTPSGPAITAIAGSTFVAPAAGGSVITAEQTDASGTRTGINARVHSSGGTAVVADGGPGAGVRATGSVLGVKASSPANGMAVFAVSGSDAVAGVANTGVYGYANQDATAVGVLGRTFQGIGVWGKSEWNTGLRGDSTTGTAVRAFSTGGRAVNATSGGTSAAGIASQSTGGKAAIQGFCGSGAVPAAEAETGVQGRCDTSANSIGVLGESSAGFGVLGDTTNGYGVTGSGYYGVYGTGAAGVVGDVDGGTGVQGWTGVAFAPAPVAHVGVWAGAENGRVALQVQGVAKFNRSGLASFAAGTSSKKVTVPGGITAAAFALATLQANRAGIWVRAVVPGTADSSITIYLNTTVASATNVGWQVLG